MLNIVLGTAAMIFFIIAGVVILKRSKSKGTEFMFDFRSFEPQELERLKGKDLLTEEEALKVQSVIANRASTWTEERRKEQEKKPVDINALLSEADKYRRSFEKSKSGQEQAPQEDPKE